jgi:hypothetical protein
VSLLDTSSKPDDGSSTDINDEELVEDGVELPPPISLFYM